MNEQQIKDTEDLIQQVERAIRYLETAPEDPIAKTAVHILKGEV